MIQNWTSCQRCGLVRHRTRPACHADVENRPRVQLRSPHNCLRASSGSCESYGFRFDHSHNPQDPSARPSPTAYVTNRRHRNLLMPRNRPSDFSSAERRRDKPHRSWSGRAIRWSASAAYASQSTHPRSNLAASAPSRRPSNSATRSYHCFFVVSSSPPSRCGNPQANGFRGSALRLLFRRVSSMDPLSIQ
jgi:hypothetical protein